MSIKVNVGVCRKLGQPGYGSVGASLNLEVELPRELLDADLAGFHARVRAAYVAAHQAVHDELARLGAATPAAPAEGHARPHPEAADRHVGNGRPDRLPAAGSRSAAPNGRSGRPVRPATPRQVAAIVALAGRQGADLDGLLADLDVTRPEHLTMAQASRLIDTLKAAADV